MNDAPLPSPIAIDGQAASGKSTLAQTLAGRFGYRVLDTGAMYRAFTLAAHERGLLPDDASACTEFAGSLDMELRNGTDTHIVLNGTDVTPRLREPQVEANVSAYSAIPGVREVMVKRQREFAQGAPSILVGRDIGTVVLPNAPIKVFLIADPDTRAARRSAQSSAWGSARSQVESGDDIARRDTIDSSRATAPLRPADDAIKIDTTAEDAEAVAVRVIALIEERRAPQRHDAATASTGGDLSVDVVDVDRIGLRPSRFRTDRAVPWFYRGTANLGRFLLWSLTRWKPRGRRNVPPTGAAILVSNHLANPDPLFLAAAVTNRRITFMAKIELFGSPLSPLIRGYGAFPVRRFESDAAALRNAMRLLRDGGLLGMFPEGTRSRTATLGELHPGTALIALRTGAPVIPCAIYGSECLRNPLSLLRRPTIGVRIGEPIAVEAIRRPSEDDVAALTARIREEIARMLPERYVSHQ